MGNCCPKQQSAPAQIQQSTSAQSAQPEPKRMELTSHDEHGAVCAAKSLKRIVVIGAGFGGLAACQKWSTMLDDRSINVQVTLVDKRTDMSVGASWQYVMMGRMELSETLRPLSKALLHPRIVKLFGTEVTAVDTASKCVRVRDGNAAEQSLQYDYLVLAPGTVSVPDSIPGLAECCIDMCSRSSCEEIARRVKACKGGETVLFITAMNPYKCPPAIFEYAFLCDEMLRATGVREGVKVIVTNPAYPFPFGSPAVHQAFLAQVAAKGIEFVPGVKPTQCVAGEVEFVGSEGPETGKTTKIKADVLIGMLPQFPPPPFKELCNEKGFIPVRSLPVRLRHCCFQRRVAVFAFVPDTTDAVGQRIHDGDQVRRRACDW